jgi:Predicted Permease Membrane Region
MSGASTPARIDLDQAFRKFPEIQSLHIRTAHRVNAAMDTVRWIISTAPEIFLLLAAAIGTVLGRVRIRGFSIGTTACTLIVGVLIGQLGTFTFPSVLRIVLFSLRGPIIVACTFVG